MQSFIAFCSICLQLSSLGDQKSEILQKRDESCTLCLAELLHPTNSNSLSTSDKSYREILGDGLYFNNPLLQEALKLKLEQQILVDPNESENKVSKEEVEVQDPFSRMMLQEQVGELLENLAQTVQKMSLSEKQLKEELIKQKNLVYQIIDKKVQLAQILYQKASSEKPNKLSLPDHLKHMKSTLEDLKLETQGFIQKQFDLKLSELSSIPPKDPQVFSDKIQEFRNMISQVHDAQGSRNFITEISLVQSQASKELTSYKSSSQLDSTFAMNYLNQKLSQISNLLHPYAKPIKNGLKTGEKLASSGHLTSENGVFNLVMQPDQKLVLYRFSVPVWASKTFQETSNNPELFFDQKSGLLIVKAPHSSSGESVNYPNKGYTGEAYLGINNNGTFSIMGPKQELWRPSRLEAVSNTLTYGSRFTTTDARVSQNGVYSLVLREDCDLVLYEHSTPIWTSGDFSSAIKDQCEVSLSDQGSLVIKSGHQNFIVVPAHPSYQGKASLLVTDDGALIIRGESKELWNSKN